MYITGVLSAVFFLQFFLGIERAGCDFYYKWIGKNGPFYIYILHMAVAVVLAKFFTFPNLMAKCAAVFAVSFLIYEAAYLIGMLIKRKKAAKGAI